MRALAIQLEDTDLRRKPGFHEMDLLTNMLARLGELGRKRVMVIGDVILDRYTWGVAERISPEAPVLVLRADDSEVRPGGAAGVAALLTALGVESCVVGAIGDDTSGRIVSGLLAEAKVDDTLLIRERRRPTTTKERVVGRTADRQPQQIVRVDHEVQDPLSPEAEAELVRVTLQRMGACDIVLVADYGKGLCTQRLLSSIIRRAKELNAPVVVDPVQNGDYLKYRGANLIKPNRREAELVTGMQIRSPADGTAAARQICQRFGFDATVITLDKDGMVLVDCRRDTQEGRGVFSKEYPADVREAYDITGAGDMALAGMGFGLALGLELVDIVDCANVLAGLEVERFGVVPVSLAQLEQQFARSDRSRASQVCSLGSVERLVQLYRRHGKRIVFTNGCFDLLHNGHVSHLEEARRLGDVLIVGVNGDASVRALKGPNRPIFCESDRAGLIAALRCVDHVVVFAETTPCEIIRRLRPDVLAKGGDYEFAEVVGGDIVESYGGQVRVTAAVEGKSTTRLVASLQRSDIEPSVVWPK